MKVLAVVAVLFGVLWLVARTQPRSPSGAVSVRDSITEATHERLRATYDAVPAWAFRDSLPGYYRERLFTADLQSRWTDTDRPIIMAAELLDVSRDSAGYTVSFGPSWRGRSDNVFFRLRATGGLAESLVEKRGDFFDEYVIVAEIYQIHRPLMEVAAIPGEVGAAEIEPISADYFVAFGELLAAELIDP